MVDAGARQAVERLEQEVPGLKIHKPQSTYLLWIDYRALGFPGADDMGNMYEHHAILGEEFRRHRSPEVARSLNPALQSFDTWLGANASRIPLG